MAIKTDTFTGGGGGGAVDSVNGQTGPVVLSANDLLADHVASNYTPADNNIDGHLSGIDTQLGTLVSGLTYKGSFNATTGAPSLANALQGDLYIISVAGTIYGKTWAVNDHLLINADMGGSVDNAKIDKIDNTEPTNVLISTNNLSDLDNASTARSNLGLGTAATSASADFLAVSNNLSDLNNATTARTNLGLGTAATLNTGTSNGNVVVLDATGLPAVDGSQLTGITATDSTKLAIANNLSDLNNATTARTNLGLGTAATSASADFLAVSNNLSDLNNATTARTNLGLGTSATLNTGTANGDVVVLDATGLPAVDGSQLTGVVSTDSSKLAIANNLSDLNNVGTARSNLGLGTAATLNTGTANGDVVVLDATGLPAVDGSQLTGITATDSSKLAIANNLSDLNNAVTARSNLGLGTAATSANTDFLASTAGLDDLSDVAYTAGPGIDNYVLTYDHASTSWGAEAAAGGGSAPSVTTDSSGTDTTISTTTGIEEIHLINNSTNNVVITIPAGATAGAGYKYNIKRLGTGTVSVAPSTGTIDTAASFSLASQFDSLTVVSDGTNYHII